MRILYQPTQGNPTGWKQVDSSGWAGLSSFICHALCVQGVVIDGFDHYSVEPVEAGIVKVIVWNDDEDDWPVGQRWAREICFRHLAPDPDPRFGGAFNKAGDVADQSTLTDGAIDTSVDSVFDDIAGVTFEENVPV